MCRCHSDEVICPTVPTVELYVMIVSETSTSTINIAGVNHIARPAADLEHDGVFLFRDISLTSNLDSIQMQSEYSNGTFYSVNYFAVLTMNFVIIPHKEEGQCF